MGILIASDKRNDRYLRSVSQVLKGEISPAPFAKGGSRGIFLGNTEATRFRTKIVTIAIDFVRNEILPVMLFSVICTRMTGTVR